MISDTKHPDYERILKFLESEVQITVGVHGDEGGQTYPDGPTIVEIAEAAEFGLGQPQRSWLRAWFDEHSAEIEGQIAAQFSMALEQRLPDEWAADRVAVWAQASIQKRIASGITPPNAKITIEKKGSSVPLIDTGLFRSAIIAYVNRRKAAA